MYSGIENEITPGVVTSLKVATETGCTRIARYAFRYAAERGRRRVTTFHKANIMKLTDGMFLDCARRVHQAEYPQVAYDEVIIDAGCMKLVQDPTDLDVLLMENLYGDLISDLCAGLVGGLGVVPGSNIGADAAVFEAVHGSAPTIAGQGHRQPAGGDHVGRDDAEPPGRDGRGGQGEGGVRRGPERRRQVAADPRPGRDGVDGRGSRRR